MSIKIALAGNPNCGKTTMYNALTGASRYVGNWPGVTVEKKEGPIKKKYRERISEDVIVTDLPGIYSLSPYTLEEVVSRDYLIDEKPDVIIDLVDATNIERNLYLTTQLMELGIPVVIALNMYDVLQKTGDVIDVGGLSRALNCPVIPTSALKEEGLEKVVSSAIELAKTNSKEGYHQTFNGVLENVISEVSGLIENKVAEKSLLRWYAIKVIERDEKAVERLSIDDSTKAKLEELIVKMEKAEDDDSESIVTNERYNYITTLVSKNVHKKPAKMSKSDAIDRIVTSRILGLPIFLGIMWFVYFVSVTWIGTPITDWTNDVLVGEWIQGGVQTFLESVNTNPVIIDVVVNGIIAGVGAVIGFLPQMAILFLLLSILEDVGYMARIAFVMDRIFRHFGLSGKSIIPLLISSGCGVPGIMASKTIENDNDRRLTIITTTSVPCGAKLPVIALIAGVIFDNNSNLAFLMYVVGILTVLISSIILKKFKAFHGVSAPFVMELPAYHMPQPKTVLIHVWERLKGFFIKAGTILFIASIVMWFLQSYGFGPEGFGLVEIDDSILAKIGTVLAPLFAPLGFANFRAIAATFSGFVAKENIVGTMGILAGAGDLVEDADKTLQLARAVKSSFNLTSVSALSFLIFNLLNSPCFAAISAMSKELDDRKIFWFGLLWQNGFAYAAALMVYQFGNLVVYGTFGAGTIAAFVVLAVLLFLLFRRDPYVKDTTVRRSVARA